jgi:tRNA threonylcarbamoyladenosine dehydratase
MKVQEGDKMMTEIKIAQDIIEKIVYYATLAPSPHNVQGWKFRVDNNVVDVYRDMDRRILKEIDPDQKEGLIAAGAAVENLTIAAKNEGFHPIVQWFPNSLDKNHLATVTLEPTQTQENNELYRYIEKRTVNRSPYKKTPVSPKILSELQEIASQEGFELRIVTDTKKIHKLAELAGEAGSIKFSHESTHRELHNLLRFTQKESAKTRDGLPLERFLIPSLLARLARYAMSWKLMKVLNPVGYNRILSYFQETQLVKSAPVVCLLIAKDGKSKNYLNGGRVFQRIALAATRHGVSQHPHSAICDLGYARVAGYHSSIPEKSRRTIDQFSKKLREHFGYEGDPHIINFFRLGYPTKVLPKRSIRRNIEEVLEFKDSTHKKKENAFSYEELITRNFPFIDKNEQIKLKNGRIAIAGCGSIGGAPFETLVRMGAERFILAEPGTYELNNLNRQHATLNDLDKNKAQVILDRAKKINPFVQGKVLPNGVTEENVHYIIGSSEVILDGVDITEQQALRAKVLLHQEAWKQQRPVVSGYDIAGTQLLKIYDYRSGKIEPLDGKFKNVDLETLTPLGFLSKVISPLDIPIEMLPVVESMIKGSKESIPQLGPTAELYGVLSSWATLDLLVGRPVRKKLMIDIPDSLRPKGTSFLTGIKRIVGIIQVKSLLMKTMKNNRTRVLRGKENTL